jgi:type II secretory pathway component PulM
MKHIITQNDLLLYLYNEVSYLEKMAIEQALKTNAQLQKELQNLRAMDEQLIDIIDTEKTAAAPSDLSLQNILNYSQRSHLTTEFY